jgi:Uncharacterized protein conserved in bacteria (DUF2252)
METLTVSTAQPAAQPFQMTPADRKAHGKRLRDAVRRDAHTGWRAPADRADPISILRAADATRQAGLVSLRYGRMLQSPFIFYRGSAGVMAADLARTPVSGIRVQVCGDCHLLNFGGFATPERRLIFDINDLDETLAGALGVGRQASRRFFCASRSRQRPLRCEWARCGSCVRSQLPPKNARFCRDGRDGCVVRAAR